MKSILLFIFLTSVLYILVYSTYNEFVINRFFTKELFYFNKENRLDTANLTIRYELNTTIDKKEVYKEKIQEIFSIITNFKLNIDYEKELTTKEFILNQNKFIEDEIKLSHINNLYNKYLTEIENLPKIKHKCYLKPIQCNSKDSLSFSYLVTQDINYRNELYFALNSNQDTIRDYNCIDKNIRVIGHVVNPVTGDTMILKENNIFNIFKNSGL